MSLQTLAIIFDTVHARVVLLLEKFIRERYASINNEKVQNSILQELILYRFSFVCENNKNRTEGTWKN